MTARHGLTLTGVGTVRAVAAIGSPDTTTTGQANMSTTRFKGHGIDVHTYAGPPTYESRRRRWQITNTLTGDYVTLSESQWAELAYEIRASAALPPLSDRDL